MLDSNAVVSPSFPQLDFLWLELTNQCNLQCSHCYAESGPHTANRDTLTRSQYEGLIAEAYEIGCRRLQFIGGEPTLNRDLLDLIRLSSDTGYKFIEVFTNLTRLSDDLLQCFGKYQVQVATSVYASSSSTHDLITRVNGSFDKTIHNLRRLMAAGIPVRAGVIEMNENAGQTEKTIRFLRSIGVQNVGRDRIRQFGRANSNNQSDMAELCGGCAENTLCVGANGKVSPCIMSKFWSVGSVLDNSLTNLSRSTRLQALRGDIYRTVVEPREGGDVLYGEIHTICEPKVCGPYGSCGPKFGPGPCAPSGCNPCFPKGIDAPLH